ncbi:Protein ENHANCED DISEASE RESISTANCE 2 [Hondaea fermentalgiana]|uniref:Protein ENHANCED DISEASE RESISTANCE 2 n=1 Tax=Hondaea fermentalgiana TaxID=2315210 RepID=A0A2R5GPD5_9STRA|nr:Protein ENHANCED DISEASE RESISTANCE 2 [Hondaea fermentalgiana]|eukprot:GBG30483.1 Protein ENHANCED DISEASE RESISTANCE 2 [Hondaea fermentalgiana]
MVNFQLTSSDPGWRESVVYDEQFVRWQTGFLLTILASFISYCWTANYSDFMRAVRKHVHSAKQAAENPAHESQRERTDARRTDPTGAQMDVEAMAIQELDSEADAKTVGTASIIAGTVLQAAKLRPLRIFLFVLSFIIFVVMDFVALAVLPLALVVPTTMMIFIWAAVYRAVCQRAIELQTAAETALIAVLVGLAVGVAPKGLYIVHVSRVVNWNAKSIIYTAVFVGVCIFIWLWRRWRPNRSRNTEAVVSGVLSGILGGQSLVLLKLVAEICENAIFHSDNEFEGASAFVVVCMSVIASGMHLFSLHATLARLDEANIRLLVPVHRLALMGSASIGAAIYLEEWKVPETTPMHVGIYYGVALLGLALVCVYFALRSRREAIAETGKRLSLQEPGAVEDAQADPGADTGDENAATRPTSPSARSRTSSWWTLGRSANNPASINSAGAEETGDANDRDLHMFKMARARSQRLSSAVSADGIDIEGLTPRPSDADELALMDQTSSLVPKESSRPSLEPRPSDLSDLSSESFHSLMDLDEEEEAEHSSPRQPGAYRLSVSHTIEEENEGDHGDHAGEVIRYNDSYPIPENTMVFPQSLGTSKSYWLDAGRVPGVWNLRGPTYDQDRVKAPCDVARMNIAALEFSYAPDKPIQQASAAPNGFIARNHMGRADRPYMIVVNFAIPSLGNFVTYLTRRTDIKDEVFDEMLDKFISAEDDDYRNARFKLIPGVLEGSYFVRKAVGAKPALLCKKLKTTYYRGDNFFEISIDVGSSSIGSRVFAAIKGFASGLVLHLAVVLESKTRAELPERLMVGVDIFTPAMTPDLAPKPTETSLEPV